jgi:hypothetical protein
MSDSSALSGLSELTLPVGGEQTPRLCSVPCHEPVGYYSLSTPFLGFSPEGLRQEHDISHIHFTIQGTMLCTLLTVSGPQRSGGETGAICLERRGDRCDLPGAEGREARFALSVAETDTICLERRGDRRDVPRAERRQVRFAWSGGETGAICLEGSGQRCGLPGGERRQAGVCAVEISGK